ncbi:TetR/AcrR family transcriptional regulator [Nocardia neocaledoniensis]
MEEISALAGLSKPVIYGDFSNKLDLYLAVLQQYLDGLVAGVRAALAGGGGHRDRVHRAVLVYFDLVEDDLAGHVLVFESSVPSEPAVQWRVTTAMRECAALLAAEIRAIGVASPRADACAWGLMGASQLAARDWAEAGRPVSKLEAADILATLCWNGLSTFECRRPKPLSTRSIG